MGQSRPPMGKILRQRTTRERFDRYPLLTSHLTMFHLDAAETAVAREVEGPRAVGGLGAAVALDTGKGGLDGVVYAHVPADANLHAAETAVDIDDGAVEEVGIPQVKGGEPETGLHIGALEALTAKVIEMLPEAEADLAYRAAILLDLPQRAVGLASRLPAPAAAPVAEEEREAPNHRQQAKDVFPKIVPRDDFEGGQQHEDTHSEAREREPLVLAVDESREAGYDDEKRPPAVEAIADVEDAHEIQGPPDAKCQQGDANDDFSCAFHVMSEL